MNDVGTPYGGSSASRTVQGNERPLPTNTSNEHSGGERRWTRVARWSGKHTRTSQPFWRSTAGSEPATSPRPPVLAQGTASATTHRTVGPVTLDTNGSGAE